MFDIPASVIKNNREWENRIHKGFWCLCYDVKRDGKKIRMVWKASKDPDNLWVADSSIYLVNPEGKKLSN